MLNNVNCLNNVKINLILQCYFNITALILMTLFMLLHSLVKLRFINMTNNSNNNNSFFIYIYEK